MLLDQYAGAFTTTTTGLGWDESQRSGGGFLLLAREYQHGVLKLYTGPYYY